MTGARTRALKLYAGLDKRTLVQRQRLYPSKLILIEMLGSEVPSKPLSEESPAFPKQPGVNDGNF